jgi:hypothetical protein
MSDPYRHYPAGGPEPLDRLVRAGFDSVMDRLEAMAERLERLEAEVAALRRRASTAKATTEPPVDTPPEARPAVASVPPPSIHAAPPTAPHIDETLVWGAPEGSDPGRDRAAGTVAGASGPERFGAELDARAGSDGSSLGRVLRRRRTEQEPTG